MPRECNSCDTAEGNGVQLYACDNCREDCCSEHSDEIYDGARVLILCDECAPAPSPSGEPPAGEDT